MATGLGIDIGSQWIKAVQVKCSGGRVTVTGALKIPNSEPGAEGSVGVPANLGAELARAGLGSSGTLGLSGREVILKYLTTPPLPPEKLRLMIDMQIGGQLIPGKKSEGSSQLTYDYRILNVPTGLQGDLVIAAGVVKNEYLFGLFAALKKARAGVHRATPSAFGLVQAYLRTQQVPKDETVVLVDVGHELLEIAILQEDHLLFARSAPGGGKRFSTALQKLLNLPDAKIEEFKQGRARLHPEGVKLQGQQDLQFQKALAEGADNIASAIRSAVMFCRTQAKMPKLDYQRVFISGGGARLRGLAEYLEAKGKRPVKVLDLYTGLDLRKLDAASARCFEGEISDMAVPLGLAVIDADPKSIHFNLMPASVLKRQLFFRKTIWAAAAGVVLMTGLYPAMVNASRSLEAVQQMKERYQQEAEQAKKLKKDFLKRRTEQVALQEKREFYARQTRPGPVFLNLFCQIREETPPGMNLVYFGPPEAVGLRGGGGLEAEIFKAPLRKLILRGYYDTSVIKDFNSVTSQYFNKLRSVPGVSDVQMQLGLDKKEFDPGVGQGAFQFNFQLADPAFPYPVKGGGAQAEKPGGAGGPAFTTSLSPNRTSGATPAPAASQAAVSALVSQANTEYEAGMRFYAEFTKGGDRNTNLRKAAEHLGKAVELYQQALQKDPQNESIKNRQVEANKYRAGCLKYTTLKE